MPELRLLNKMLIWFWSDFDPQMLSILIEKLSTAPDAGLENTTAHKQFLAKFRKRANGPSEKVEFDHDVQVNF